MRRQQIFYYAFLGLAIVLGVVLIWVSTISGINVNNDLLSAMGGAILGVSASMLIGSLLNYSEIGEIHQALSNLANVEISKEKLTSDVSLLRQLKGEWYCYTVSKREEETLWKVVKYNFSVNERTGKISFVGRFKDNIGRKRIFKYRGMRRDERFIIVGKSDEDPQAPCILQVFPYLGNITPAYYCGFTFHRTWNAVHSISPTILVRHPIEAFVDDEQASEQLSRKLDNMWLSGFKTRNDLILPRILDPV